MPTLGELQAAGWHGLQTTCRSCRVVAVLLWARLQLQAADDLGAVIRRLRCSRCRCRPLEGDVQLYYCDTASAEPGARPPGVEIEHPT